jgi:predicted Zn-dependent protease
MIRPVWRRVVPCVAATLLGACGVDEAALGKASAAQIDTQVAFVADPVVQADLARLGNALLRAAGPQPYAWRFRVVRNDQINAFALPGGYVYVQTGLLSAVRDVNELGGVLGHEIAHAVLHHGVQQERKRQAGTMAISAVCALTGWCDGGLSQAAINIGEAAVYSKFSRTDELQADSAGVLWAARAGLDPHGVARFFGRLEGERTADQAVSRFFASHPMERERMARIERLIGGVTPRPAPDSLVVLFNELKARAAGPRTPPR